MIKLINSKDIEKAYRRIKAIISKTPLITNDTINKNTNSEIYFKLENLQKTGSFKIRGAANKISKLSNKDKLKGIVSYSSGNHAQAVAYVSKYFNIKSTIVMPENAPLIKINNTKKYGAKILFYDPKKESRENIAQEIARRENKTIIKPYDDLDIIAGQGTAGKEIIDDLKELKIEPDIYVCCCGGGGLVAGTTTYMKTVFPRINNYSAEPAQFNDTELSLKTNSIIKNKKNSKSICDALLAPQPGKITFPINKLNLKKGLSVSDNEVKKTIIELAENLKIISEPGGAVAAAAILNNKINIKNKKVVVMISGGNIDYSLFSKIVSSDK
ncbi:MAG: L-threonine dehydratase catabolic TdcB [Alphaproteobacteria bacterium MarineAlpha5_Bin6]|nr:MAG: L-threonine dehydratase catabolic TdcB [Alphaproteobacteria bacterium MarineAlpha5_Bin6]|tara:strand:- start:2002 stop:2985 length:984 start_codon:yes stop_codon:yes gene_type:complete